MLTVVPQGTADTDAGLTDIEIPTTWNGPGSLHTPVGATVVETSVFPDIPALIDPLMADAEFSWTTKLLSVYFTVWLVCPGVKVTLPVMGVWLIFPE